MEHHDGNGCVMVNQSGQRWEISGHVLIWLLVEASPEQRVYIGAKLRFDQCEMERDRLLAPIDSGERTLLTPGESLELERLNTVHKNANNALLAAEEPLLMYAQRRLQVQPELLTHYPEYMRLKQSSLGQRDEVLDLAACLGLDWEAESGSIAPRFSTVLVAQDMEH